MPRVQRAQIKRCSISRKRQGGGKNQTVAIAMTATASWLVSACPRSVHQSAPRQQRHRLRRCRIHAGSGALLRRSSALQNVVRPERDADALRVERGALPLRPQRSSPGGLQHVNERAKVRAARQADEVLRNMVSPFRAWCQAVRAAMGECTQDYTTSLLKR